jgi:SMI1 / KNR4 family (SUKH-1)
MLDVPPFADIEATFWNTTIEYGVYPPLTRDHIVAAERELGVKLPETLLRLLRIQNGGAVASTWNTCPTASNFYAGNHVPFDHLFGIGPATATGPTTLLDTTNLVQEWGLPTHVVLLSGEGHHWIALDTDPPDRMANPASPGLTTRCSTNFAWHPASAPLSRDSHHQTPTLTDCIEINLAVRPQRGGSALISAEQGAMALSAGGHERGEYVDRVPVEVLAGAVVAHGGARVGVASSDLHVAGADAGVEHGGHEGMPQQGFVVSPGERRGLPTLSKNVSERIRCRLRRRVIAGGYRESRHSTEASKARRCGGARRCGDHPWPGLSLGTTCDHVRPSCVHDRRAEDWWSVRQAPARSATAARFPAVECVRAAAGGVVC